MTTYIKNKIVDLYNKFTPAEIPKVSEFKEKGILTPYEFMEAGDRLILANPIWSWQKAAKPQLTEKTLDLEKQFLSAQIVSKRRLHESRPEAAETHTTSDGWTNIDMLVSDIRELKIEEEIGQIKKEPEDKVVDLEDVLDSDDENHNDEIKESKEVHLPIKNENLRIYKVCITYDRHYLTPRFWLSGLDYLNRPLSKEQIFEEIMGEYKDKTVTYDKHPHLDVVMANIHPCRHAEVIKSLVNQASSNGKEIKPDQCLFIFLKFISSVMPSLEIDFTTEIEI